MAKLSSGFPIDVAYGSTPEKAILSLLLKHPEYLGERPAFADVDARPSKPTTGSSTIAARRAATASGIRSRSKPGGP